MLAARGDIVHWRNTVTLRSEVMFTCGNLIIDPSMCAAAAAAAAAAAQ